MTNDQSNDRTRQSSWFSMLLAMQTFIMGGVLYLLLRDLGIEQHPAGQLLALVWVGGAIVYLIPDLTKGYINLREWWSS